MHPTPRDEILDLIGRYCEAVLRFDPEQFSGCWAPDGVWVMPGDRDDVVGPDECTALFADLRAGYPLCTQEILSSVVELDEEARSGRVRSVVRECQWSADGPGQLLVGVYHDEVVRTPGGWRFARRRFEAFYRGPVDLTGRVYDRREH